MRNLIALLMVFALIGCSSSNVSYDYDKTVDFSALRTYQFTNVTGGLQNSPLFLKRLESAIDAYLLAKGFTRTDNAPDFTIRLHRSVEQRKDFYEWGSPYGYYGYRGYYSGYRGYGYNRRMDIYEYEEETIYLSFFSSSTKEIIWYSARAAILHPTPTPEAKQKKANEITQGLLINFPPPLQ
jgi:hypothetical protein